MIMIAAFLIGCLLGSGISESKTPSYNTILSSDQKNENVICVSVESCWLWHGSISAVASSISMFSGNSATHWYCIAETENAYYVVQFGSTSQGGKGCISITRFDSLLEARQCGCGLDTDDKKKSGKEITIKVKGKPLSKCTIGDVKTWADNQSNDYNTVSNNCQHFGNNFSKKYLGKLATNESYGKAEI